MLPTPSRNSTFSNRRRNAVSSRQLRETDFARAVFSAHLHDEARIHLRRSVVLAPRGRVVRDSISLVLLWRFPFKVTWVDAPLVAFAAVVCGLMASRWSCAVSQFA